MIINATGKMWKDRFSSLGRVFHFKKLLLAALIALPIFGMYKLATTDAWTHFKYGFINTLPPHALASIDYIEYRLKPLSDNLRACTLAAIDPKSVSYRKVNDTIEACDKQLRVDALKAL